MMKLVRYGGLLICFFCQRLSPPNAPYQSGDRTTRAAIYHSKNVGNITQNNFHASKTVFVNCRVTILISFISTRTLD